jgi:hypothetical protein
MADPIPDEQVYLDAATAYVRADGVNDGYVEGMIHDKPFRAAVDSAYRAGCRRAAGACCASAVDSDGHCHQPGCLYLLGLQTARAEFGGDPR